MHFGHYFTCRHRPKTLAKNSKYQIKEETVRGSGIKKILLLENKSGDHVFYILIQSRLDKQILIIFIGCLKKIGLILGYKCNQKTMSNEIS